MPLRAIVLPRVIAQGPSDVVTVASAIAHKAIAMSTIELSRWTGGHTLRKVSELLRERPCYELRVGASIDEVPPLLDQAAQRASIRVTTRTRGENPPAGAVDDGIAPPAPGPVMHGVGSLTADAAGRRPQVAIKRIQDVRWAGW